MDNPDKASALRPCVKLDITKAVGIAVHLEVSFDPESVVATLERVARGENPLAVFSEFVCHLAVKRLQFDTDEPIQRMQRPSPSHIALPNGIDPRALRVGG